MERPTVTEKKHKFIENFGSCFFSSFMFRQIFATRNSTAVNLSVNKNQSSSPDISMDVWWECNETEEGKREVIKDHVVEYLKMLLFDNYSLFISLRFDIDLIVSRPLS